MFKNNFKKVIAIDFWDKKIWTAVWDTMMQIPFPKENFSTKEKLFEFIKKNDFEIIILWNPQWNEDFFSEQQEKCEKIFNELENIFSDKKIIFLDERYSSKIAQQRMKSIWLSQKKWKKHEDNLSAQVLLETFFDIWKL